MGLRRDAMDGAGTLLPCLYRVFARTRRFAERLQDPRTVREASRARSTFFYGVNFEFSVNYRYWESRRITSEVRPIIGVHLHPVDIIVNPIVDTDYVGGFGGLDFVPAARIAYNFNKQYAVAVEEYADCGTLNNFLPANDQFHEVWAVLDRGSKKLSIETGIGFGVTAGADKVTRA